MHEFIIKWKNHQNQQISSISQIFSWKFFSDVSLIAEGKSISCHKVILASASDYFLVSNDINF